MEIDFGKEILSSSCESIQFNDLKNRKIKDVLVVVTDNLRVLKKAVSGVFLRADYQRCVVHKVINTLRKVRYSENSLVKILYRIALEFE